MTIVEEINELINEIFNELKVGRMETNRLQEETLKEMHCYGDKIDKLSEEVLNETDFSKKMLMMKEMTVLSKRIGELDTLIKKRIINDMEKSKKIFFKKLKKIVKKNKNKR